MRHRRQRRRVGRRRPARATSCRADGTPGSAAFPSVSGDGRYVSFTASKPLAGGETGIGPWVYVADRANGSIRRVSNGPMHAYHTSITRDGSQVAYTVGPPTPASTTRAVLRRRFNCPGIRIDVAFGPAPGFTTRRSRPRPSASPRTAAPPPAQHFAAGAVGQRTVGGVDLERRRATRLSRTRSFGLATRSCGAAIRVSWSTRSTSARSAPTRRRRSRRPCATPAARRSRSTRSRPRQGSSRSRVAARASAVRCLPPGATCTVNVRYAAPNNTSTTNGSITVAESGYDPISAAGRLIGRSSFTPPPVTTTTVPRDDDHGRPARSRRPSARRPPRAPPPRPDTSRSPPTPTRSTSGRSQSASARRSRP